MSLLRRTPLAWTGLALLATLLPQKAVPEIVLAKPGGEPRVVTPSLAADGVTRVGSLELRMLDGGFFKEAASGHYYPGAHLQFRNLDARRFHQSVTIELWDRERAKKLASWKTFVSLKKGQVLRRRYGKKDLALWTDPAATPDLHLVLRLGVKRAAEALLLSRKVLVDGPDLQPALETTK